MSHPRSSTGLPPGIQVGATGPRLLAALVEVGPVWLLSGLAVLFWLVLDARVLAAALCLVLALVWAVLVWAQRATRAAGPGMRLDSLQIVGFRDGRPLGWGRVLLRWAVFAGLTVSVVGLIALAIVMARHPRRQGWHDLAANAVVIKERPLAPRRPKPAVSKRTGRPAPALAKEPPAAKAATAGKTRPPTAGSPATATQATATQATATQATATQATATPAESPAPDAAVPSSPESAEPSGGPPGPDGSGAPDRGADGAIDPEWWLRLDDGRDVGVERLVLLGRNPQPRVGEEDATLIKVVDETRTVSKSHLAVGVDARGLFVMDRGSTNGTTVTSPDGDQRPCPPGDMVDVPGGSVVSFGDHWLEVRRA